MAILRKIITGMLTLWLVGCYEDFVPETDVEPVLCLNSLITAGEPIEVMVSHTWLFTDQRADASVDDAVTVIWVNGERMSADYLPKEGDHIKITADSRRYGHAEGEVTVPYATPIESLDWKPIQLSVVKGETEGREMMWYVTFNMDAEIVVPDWDDAENYYRFSYSSFAAEHYGDAYADFYAGSFKEESEPIFSEHIGVFESISGGDSYGFTFFTDRQFSGKSYPLHIQFTDVRYYVNSKEWQPELLECGYEFMLHSVSKSYYSWANYVWQRDEGPRGDLSEVGFGEPLWGYSNVSTGAGVIAAQSSSTYRLNLKDFIETNLQNN